MQKSRRNLLAVSAGSGLCHSWREFGGIETSISYGMSPRMLLVEHRFEEARNLCLKKLPSRISTSYSVSNSQSRGSLLLLPRRRAAGKTARSTRADASLWIREEFLEPGACFGRIVVDGYTPVDGVEFWRGSRGYCPDLSPTIALNTVRFEFPLKSVEGESLPRGPMGFERDHGDFASRDRQHLDREITDIRADIVECLSVEHEIVTDAEILVIPAIVGLAHRHEDV